MTYDKILLHCIKHTKTIKDSCAELGENFDLIRMDRSKASPAIMAEYKRVMANVYDKIANEKYKAKRKAKAERSGKDMKFRCPCGKCGTVGGYCKQQYYKEVTGHDYNPESSFDSVYRHQFGYSTVMGI